MTNPEAEAFDAEAIEKVRQEIMRFRELLNLMRGMLEDGERAYAALFSGFSAEALAHLKEKDAQWQLAAAIVADTSEMRQAVLRLRFETRNLEHDFEQLHDIITANAADLSM